MRQAMQALGLGNASSGCELGVGPRQHMSFEQGCTKPQVFSKKAGFKKASGWLFFGNVKRKMPAAGFFLHFSGFFQNFLKFPLIPTKFHENFDEMRSDIMRFASKSQKFDRILENIGFC